jgi:hypothetical protein
LADIDYDGHKLDQESIDNSIRSIKIREAWNIDKILKKYWKVEAKWNLQMNILRW